MYDEKEKQAPLVTLDKERWRTLGRTLAEGKASMSGMTVDGPVRLKPETKARIVSRAGCCFCCKRIVEALSPENELRNWPPGSTGEAVDMNVNAQIQHVQLELKT